MIENIKEGDLVIVRGRFYEAVRTVEKITPSGLIKVDGRLYYKSGSERGGDVWNRYYIKTANPQEIQKIKDNETIQIAFKLMRNVSKITLAQAKQIIEILKESEQKNDRV